MVRQPMARDALSIAEPNFFVALHVIHQFRQRTDASRAADDSSMQPDAHHARMTFASSSIKPIEGIAAILKKMLAGGEICAKHRCHIEIRRPRRRVGAYWVPAGRYTRG